jgi:protein arginine N-methyltransferase 1
MNRLVQKLIGGFFRFLLRLKTKIFAQPRLAQLYYQLANKEHFVSLALHERMLADQVRVGTYAQAIAKYVKESDVVFDLGTGTGILAFLAAAQGAKKIYAIDHAEIIETAKALAVHNGFTRITFIKAPAQTVTLPEQVEVLVQEQMGSWLFNENMIETVLLVRDRWLKAGGRILPARFELWLAPVQLKDEYRVPLLWEQRFAAISFAPLQSLKDRVGAEHFQVTIKPYEVARFLCPPQALLQFNLETLRPHELPTTLQYHGEVAAAGRLDGFCLYFKALFDEEIFFTTSPLPETHTHTCWSVPLYRVEARPQQPGDRLEFTLQMPELRNQKTWQWRYQHVPAATSRPSEAASKNDVNESGRASAKS